MPEADYERRCRAECFPWIAALPAVLLVHWAMGINAGGIIATFLMAWLLSAHAQREDTDGLTVPRSSLVQVGWRTPSEADWDTGGLHPDDRWHSAHVESDQCQPVYVIREDRTPATQRTNGAVTK